MTKRKQYAFNWGNSRIIGQGQVKPSLSVALVDIRKGARPLKGELWIYVSAEPGLTGPDIIKKGEGTKVLDYGDRLEIQKVFKRKVNGATGGNGKDDGNGTREPRQIDGQISGVL